MTLMILFFLHGERPEACGGGEQLSSIKKLVVLQKCWEERWGMKLSFLLSLGSHSKQVCDEGDLLVDVSFVHAFDLSLANHVHDLISLECFPCCLEGEKAHPWFG